MPTQMPSQFTKIPICSKSAQVLSWNARLAHLLVVMAVGGVLSPVVNGEAPSSGSLNAPPVAAGASQFDPAWANPRFWEAVRRIWLLIDGDGGTFDQVATTPEAAMNLVVSRYNTFGIPADLTPAERDELMADLDAAVCELKTAPSSVDPVTRTLFVNTATVMWLELGGIVEALGC